MSAHSPSIANDAAMLDIGCGWTECSLRYERNHADTFGNGAPRMRLEHSPDRKEILPIMKLPKEGFRPAARRRSMRVRSLIVQATKAIGPVQRLSRVGSSRGAKIRRWRPSGRPVGRRRSYQVRRHSSGHVGCLAQRVTRSCPIVLLDSPLSASAESPAHDLSDAHFKASGRDVGLRQVALQDAQEGRRKTNPSVATELPPVEAWFRRSQACRKADRCNDGNAPRACSRDREHHPGARDHERARGARDHGALPPWSPLPARRLRSCRRNARRPETRRRP